MMNRQNITDAVNTYAQKEKVKWLIEEYIVNDDDRLVAEIKRQGYEVKILPHNYKKPHEVLRSTLRNYYPDESCVIFMGSLNTGRKIRTTVGWIPGTITMLPDCFCDNYYQPLVGKDILLNDQYLYLPLYDVFRFLTAINADDKAFIRPNNPYKTFTGQVVDATLQRDKFYAKNNLTKYNDRDLVLISSVRNIDSEYRFLMDGQSIVSCSQYKDGDETVYSNGAPVAVRNLAIEVAGLLQGMIDKLCVLDIALVYEDSTLVPKLVELGAVSTSSLYEADFENVVSVLSTRAYEEWREYHA